MNQLQGMIDPANGNIVIHMNGQILFGLAPKDALAFVAGLAGLISGHPKLQADDAPQIVLAGANSIPDLRKITEGWNGH